MKERTFVIVKPDGVKRGLVGEIIKKYEQKNLCIEALEFTNAPKEVLEKHYEEHAERPFFGELVDFMMSGPLVKMILSGDDAIAVVRKVNGATNHLNADNGSIRGMYAFSTTENLVHASDSVESAEREIGLWF